MQAAGAPSISFRSCFFSLPVRPSPLFSFVLCFVFVFQPEELRCTVVFFFFFFQPLGNRNVVLFLLQQEYALAVTREWRCVLGRGNGRCCCFGFLQGEVNLGRTALMRFFCPEVCLTVCRCFFFASSSCPAFAGDEKSPCTNRIDSVMIHAFTM